MVYVDGRILLGKDDKQLKATIHEIQDAGLNIEDQGHPTNYIRTKIKKMKHGSYEFTQQALIDAIIKDISLTNAKVKPMQLYAFNTPPLPCWARVAAQNSCRYWIRAAGAQLHRPC